MKIGKPKFIQQNNKTIYSVTIETSEDNKELWYSVSEEFGSLMSDACDAALVALLIPAMAIGEDIYIDGWVSEKLYHNLSFRYQKILQTIIPSLTIVKINANNLQAIDYKATGIATGFSAGVDSFCTLKDYFFDEIPPSLKITHLTYHNVGSHGNTEHGRDLFHKRFSQLKSVTEKMEGGIPFIMIDSNVDSFYTQEHLYFMQTHTPRNMSVALLLQKGLGTFLYSSALSYEDVQVRQAYNIDICDPITLPLISTESVNLTAVGSEYSRVEKTLRIVNILESHNSLDVCVTSEKGENCSVCFKCMRTQLTLDIAGKLNEYEKVFNYHQYERNKQQYLKKILKSNSKFEQELVNYAKRKNYPLPFFDLHYGKIIKNMKTVKKMLKKVMQ